MRLVSLLSGGIDSPVSTYLMAKAGAEVILLHMDNGCYSDGKDLEKVFLLKKQLENELNKEFPLYVIKHEANQTAIKENCEKGYQCVLCKRIMQNIAKEFAKKNNCDGIIMGDSLGQVASQTLKNIAAECKDLDFPILRPLIGLDKLEIISIAEKIGTYKISIIKANGCSAVPDKPITEAKYEKIIELQSCLDFEELILNSINSAKLFNVCE